MERYRNLSGKSGVKQYEIRPESIIIEFDDGVEYEYNQNKPGKRHVDKMKILAEKGRGLATYINKNVRGNYAAKKD